MPDKESINKKAYEIAYAVGRVVPTVPAMLGDALLGHAVTLLNAVLADEDLVAGRSIGAVGYFIKLGYGLDAISQRNTDLLLEQLRILDDMVTVGLSRNTAKRKPADIDLSEVFSDGFGNVFTVSDIVTSGPISDMEVVQPSVVSESGNPAKDTKNLRDEKKLESENVSETKSDDETAGFAASLSSGIRQSAILARIRQSGNCRMKELQDMFPQSSERTIRYDLEYLIGRHLVERIGAGSATTYRPVVESPKER